MLETSTFFEMLCLRRLFFSPPPSLFLSLPVRAVFLLIGKTSALTMNIAGVIKDWILIFSSSLLFNSPITALNLIGYFMAFLAVAYYNYTKYQDMKSKAAAGDKAIEKEDAAKSKVTTFF